MLRFCSRIAFSGVAVSLLGGTSFACIGTDLGAITNLPNYMKVCEGYVQGDDNAMNQKGLVSGQGVRFGNPENWVAIGRKFNYFRRYELASVSTRRHCSHSTHSIIGVVSDNGLRTCHFAFEEYSVATRPISRFLSTENGRYSLESKNTESGNGEKTITVSTYCRADEKGLRLTTVEVKIPQKSREDGKSYEDYMEIKERPLQHAYFTNQACDTPSE